jgi:hypothetical protein
VPFTFNLHRYFAACIGLRFEFRKQVYLHVAVNLACHLLSGKLASLATEGVGGGGGGVNAAAGGDAAQREAALVGLLHSYNWALATGLVVVFHDYLERQERVLFASHVKALSRGNYPLLAGRHDDDDVVGTHDDESGNESAPNQRSWKRAIPGFRSATKIGRFFKSLTRDQTSELWAIIGGGCTR